MSIPCSKDAFVLDESADLGITTDAKTDHPRWVYPIHLDEARYSLVLVAGERLETGSIRISSDSKLFIRFATAKPAVGLGGLGFSVRFQDLSTGTEIPIAAFGLSGITGTKSWRMAELDLEWLAGLTGHFVIVCDHNSQGNSNETWLAISDFCIAPEGEIKAQIARSHNALRTRNELAHFSQAYRNEMYSAIQDRQSKAAMGIERKVRALGPTDGNDQLPDDDFNLAELVPSDSDSVYSYAIRLLTSGISVQPPNFISRLRELVRTRGTVRVLSLCSGAARIEAGQAAAVGANVEWTLLDINEDLLQMAAKQFPASTKLDLIRADANQLVPTGEKWDVILCVSALHHLVELEQLMRFVRDSLAEDGEFWSIGEAVGRNGNRLWPEAKRAADAVFSELPEKYRLNSHTKAIDTSIPNTDFSIACFEGIRSEEILPILDRWLKPVNVYRRNCFLWRILNLAYCNNYNLADSDDRSLIVRLVKAELAHFRNSGRGTELFGVFALRDF
jgi:SAM-dependent methyltransferase